MQFIGGLFGDVTNGSSDSSSFIARAEFSVSQLLVSGDPLCDVQ